jgi:broad specificity phosphatase PhoE
MRHWLLAIALALAGGLAGPASAGVGPPDKIVVVVRHAEKAADDPRDPTLSAEGQARAERLAVALRGLKLGAVYTTQYPRTRLTAAPAAKACGVEVTVREANAANNATYARDLANEIRQGPPGQAVLVVGHSNTVPELVQVLTGATPEPMADTEFDRIYVVSLPADGPARVVVLRY